MAQLTPKAMTDSELPRVLETVEVVEVPTLSAKCPRERAGGVTIASAHGERPGIAELCATLLLNPNEYSWTI